VTSVPGDVVDHPALRVAVVSSPITARAARLLGELGCTVELADRAVVVEPVDVALLPSDDDEELGAAGRAARALAGVEVIVTAWGRGARADWPASDHVVAAAGGWSAQIGLPDGPPAAPPHEQAWALTAVAAAIAVLTYGRRRVDADASPRRSIEIAAVDVVAATLEVGALSWIHDRRVTGRPGRRHPLVAHELTPAVDGWIATGLGGNEAMWQRLRDWLVDSGIATLADRELDDPVVRRRRRDDVAAGIARFCATRRRIELADEAQSRRVPWAAVLERNEVAASPQLVARRFDLAAPRLPWITTLGPPRSLASGAESAGSTLLDGVVVLDLTWVLAGPFATRILADHGADVVKVESAHRPDPTRFAPMMHLGSGEPGHGETSGYFANHNRNKRSITLNLREDAGRDILQRLIAGADVVIDNFSAGTLSRWGLGPAALWELRPDLVVVEMSGMGQDGPWSSWVSYADAVSSLSGLTAATTDPAGEPMGVVFGLADLVAGYHGALAVVGALAERRRSGRGSYLDLAQLEAMAYNLWSAAPSADDGTTDTHVLAADEQWCALSADDDRLCSYRDLARELDADGLSARARADGFAAAVVADGKRLVTEDADVRAVPFYLRADHPFVGAPLVEADPIIVDGARPPIRRSAPLLGTDTDAVLSEIAKLRPDEIADARVEGVLE